MTPVPMRPRWGMDNPRTAARWRQMAHDARTKARTMHEGWSKREMLKIAAGYEELARRVDLPIKEC